MFESWLLSLGYSVFPLRAGSKRPDAETLSAWGLSGSWKPLQSQRIAAEKQWPREKNIGVVTGQVSGIVVVDFDDAESWHAGQVILGKTGAGLVVKTRRGFHAYFRHPGTEVRNGAKVKGQYDIRGDGGYVVGPTSVVDGCEYQVTFGSLADRDQWPVFDDDVWLEESKEVSAGPREVKSWERYKMAVVNGEFDRVSQATEGHRHDTLKTASIKLGSYVGGGALDRGECVGILLGAAKVCQLPEREARSCIMAGIEIGKQNPRNWVDG